MDKWQNLENKEGTEIEKLRKERINLEVKLREVETRLLEREQQLSEELELKEAKIEKFRSRLRDYVVRFDFCPHLPPFIDLRSFCVLECRQGITGVHRTARTVMRGTQTDGGRAQREECEAES